MNLFHVALIKSGMSGIKGHHPARHLERIAVSNKAIADMNVD